MVVDAERPALYRAHPFGVLNLCSLPTTLLLEIVMTVIRDRSIVTNNTALVRFAMRFKFLFIQRARVGTDVESFFRISF